MFYINAYNVIMESLVENMLREQNYTLLNIIDNFQFYFQKLLYNNIERWARFLCNSYIKSNSEHKVSTR